MAITFKLPAVIDDGRIDIFLKWLNLAKDYANADKRIVLDWSKVTTISPAGQAVLACLFDTFVEQRNDVRCAHVPKKIKSIPVVQNLLQLRQYSQLPTCAIHNYQSGNMLLKSGTSSIDPLFVEHMVALFETRASEDVVYAATLIINELMQNSVDHSTSERYYVYAGLWQNEFHAGLLDMGITVPAKLRQKYMCEDDLDALKMALQKGISTRRMRTGGFGLYYFFELLKCNQGKLTIVSGAAQIRRYFKTRKSQMNILKYVLPGTWCFARFPLEGLR